MDIKNLEAQIWAAFQRHKCSGEEDNKHQAVIASCERELARAVASIRKTFRKLAAARQLAEAKLKAIEDLPLPGYENRVALSKKIDYN